MYSKPKFGGSIFFICLREEDIHHPISNSR